MLVVDPGVLQLTERNSPQKESEKEMKTNANSLGLSCYVLLNTLFESRAVLLCSLLLCSLLFESRAVLLNTLLYIYIYLDIVYL